MVCPVKGRPQRYPTGEFAGRLWSFPLAEPNSFDSLVDSELSRKPAIHTVLKNQTKKA
jgi:hypothetical protein